MSPSTIGSVHKTRWQVARSVYDASRNKGWGRIRALRWARGAWKRWPNGMTVDAKVIV